MEGRKKSRIIRINRQSTEENGFKFFTNLPIDLLMDILSRLSIKSIFRFRSVCKEWRQTLLTTDFAKLHFSRAPTCPLLYNPKVKSISKLLYLVEIERDRLCRICDGDNPRKKACTSYYRRCKNHVDMEISTRFLLPNLGCCELSVVNSCRGLLCLKGVLSKDPIVIYNPVTSEYTILPYPIEGEPNIVAGGLGFCQRIKKYKVLAILPEKKLALVYTFGSGEWRPVGIAPGAFRFGLSNTTFINGALHWLVADRFNNILILYFNLDDEHFKTILPPPCTMNRYYPLQPNHVDRVFQGNVMYWGSLFRAGKRIGVLRDQIFVCGNFLESQPCVWTLEDYVDQQSWFKKYEFPPLPPGLYQPIELLKDVGVLLHEANNAFVICGQSKFRYFEIHGFRTIFGVTPHTPSFLSLKEAVGDSVEVLTVSESQGKTRQLRLVEDIPWNA